MGRMDALRAIADDAALREEILDRCSGNGDLAAPQDPVAEAIVLLLGRPVLRVRDDDVDLAELETDTWRQRLDDARAALRATIPAVGRIELRNHPQLDWVGTGWVIADDVIVTNRHVAEVFARRRGADVTFRPVPPTVMEARIDFREEHAADTPAEFRVAQVLHIEEEPGPDIAFLRIDWNGDANAGPRRPIPLSTTIDPGRDVAVIGYPAKDTRTRIPEEMDRIFGNVYNVKRLAPGRLTLTADERGHANHDCTTLGGNSGSAVVDLQSGEAVALHFAGRERERNIAVPAPVVHAALQRLRPATATRPSDPEPGVADIDARSGYDAAFLGVTVKHPELTCGLAAAVAPVVGSDDGILRYTHYSVRMHRFRRLAMYVAVNIDGRAARRVPRGSDNWRTDPRLDPQFQADNDLYRHNNLDRGHLVRRLDPAWGDTFDDAKTGARDTFFYTNCAPQHRLHNQRLWLGLEDHILDSATTHQLRASVFTGPIFRPDDRVYRDIQLPEDFWKVVAIVNTETDRLSVTGYVVSQRDFMHDLEFVFGAYETYQVPVATIEQQTGLAFGLNEFDPLGSVEGIAARPLQRPTDIVL